MIIHQFHLVAASPHLASPSQGEEPHGSRIRTGRAEPSPYEGEGRVRFRPLLVVLLVLVGVLFSSTPTVQALSVRPTTIETAVSPGGSSENVFFLKNDEAVEQTYYFSLQKFIPSGDSGRQEFLPPSEIDGLPSWIYFEHPSITIPAGATRPVAFAVRPPNDAAVGGNYAAIFVSSQPPEAVASGIGLRSRLGVLVFATVQGAIVKHLRLESWERLSSSSLTHLPASFQALVRNEGNAHQIPEGAIAVTNIFGRTVARLLLNEAQGRVLPNSTRRFPVVWQKQESQSGSGYWHEVGEEWRNFAFGKYQVRFTGDGEGWGNEHVPALEFYVWPWHLMTVAGAALILVWILLRGYGRWILYRATVGH